MVDVTKLPKVDLHLHLDGSVKPETVVDLAEEAGVELPGTDRDTLSRLMQVKGDCASLQEYLSKFAFVGAFLHSPSALQRIAFELVEQAAEQRCKYVEVRFGPQLHRNRGLSVEEVIQAVVEGLGRGEAAFGVKARGIATCLRSHSDAQNREVIEAAAKFIGGGIVAVDLAGDEASYPAERFADVFAIARRRDIPVTIHAGEAAGPKNIYDAVTKLGAVRIGHGVRLREDEEVYRFIRKRRIPLEMCPVSNIQTKAAPAWHAYPIRDYFDRELHVTVNTDNLTVSDTNLGKEYAMLQQHFDFRPEEIRRLVLNGVDAAFLSDGDKRELRRAIEAEFALLGIA
ncbi:adenosine deaminase [Paenibacillus sp.]|uniref:adenosine deaminase n=1 Tax=Paenibacillus sp. TaxID=58172 RepID=UPI002D6B1E05|nr:adenosine deaminase [Paenibacillus sp.]HZG87708.1 adenosine deaminase [Paenibacillus sp.]